ncbi:MAG: hypothetical protein M5U34_02220 [Chloroflexi bacterium]|nr:hypothetical protein [Chloroflexota bacterium]
MNLTTIRATPSFIIRVSLILFYLWTLAPGVLWGDDAYFQTAAFLGDLPADGSVK